MTSPAIKKALNDKQLRAMGLVAAEWSLLERIIFQGIEHIAFDNYRYANVVLTNFNNPTMLKIFDALLSTCNKNKLTIEKYQKLRTRIDDARKKRNDVLHGVWSWHPDDDTAALLDNRSGKRLDVVIKPKTTKEMENIADEISELVKDLDNFMKKYIYQLPPSHERH